jgi:Clp amino terminal domain, pathogenicity island component
MGSECYTFCHKLLQKANFLITVPFVSATICDLVERGKREAATLGNDWVGTELLLLAIIQTADASLSSILAGAGVSVEAARRAIHKVLYS